jgi:hypothetical protein
MKTPTQGIKHYVALHQNRVVENARCLFHISSDNRAPRGYEDECRRYVGDALRRSGLELVLSGPDEAPVNTSRSFYGRGRNGENRRKAAARRMGPAGGRSLIFPGQIGTDPHRVARALLLLVDSWCGDSK